MKVRLLDLRECLRRGLEEILAEGRVEDARAKYPNISQEDFDFLTNGQPDGSNNKYLMWSCKQVAAGHTSEATVAAVVQFEGNKQRLKKKDINQYKTVDEVDTAVKALPEKKVKKKGDTDLIYKDDRFIVLRPHTEAASCKYGTGTKWCISATRTRNYFASYSTDNNKFYFVIDRKAEGREPTSKFAIAIVDSVANAGDRIQVFNAPDRQVGLPAVAQHVGDTWPAMWEKIQAHVRANPITREVAEARKKLEEHVKTLLEGGEINNDSLKKIATKAELTTSVVTALIAKAQAEEPAGQWGYSTFRRHLASKLGDRAPELSRESSLAAITWLSNAGGNNNYYVSYPLQKIFGAADLSSADLDAIAQGTTDEQTLSTIMMNPNASEELKRSIAAQVERFTTREAKKKVYAQLIIDGTITVEQFATAMGPGYYLANTLLDRPDMTARLTPAHLRLIPISNAHELERFAALPSVTPVLAGEALVKHMDKFQKNELYELLRTMELTLDAIEGMWRTADTHAKVSLLQNPSVGVENATKFASSRNSAFRFAVAHNTVTPPEALAQMALDVSASTRSAIAANTSTPGDTLAQLATDSATAVRASVAGNTSTPEKILKALKKDSETFIRRVASKTLKTKQTAEATIRELEQFAVLIVEELADDDTPDVMSPSWRNLPKGYGGLAVHEFIAVFLLQNNGSATREQVERAYQDWTGVGGAKALWKRDRYARAVYMGSTAGGKGWYWSPPGINKGALYRLTPAGASAALAVLDKYRTADATRTPRSVSSKTARPGTTYYTQNAQQAVDVTRLGPGTITTVEVEADAAGNIALRRGKPIQLSPNRSRRARWGERMLKVYKHTSPAGVDTWHKTLPKVQVPERSEVTYVQAMHGYERTKNQAIVTYGRRTVIVDFPLQTHARGEEPPTVGPEVRPPVATSAPPAALTPGAEQQPRAQRQPRAAGGGRQRRMRATYKIYAPWKGHAAATRLRGQAYAPGPDTDTEFVRGDQAVISVTDDGKLQVKKTNSDHTQVWEPVDG